MLTKVYYFALFLSIFLANFLKAQSFSTKKPNIIFIVADDLGYGDIGAYGQQKIKTPHLDKMAKEGIKFTQFYAGSTVCAPSRCVLMTGKHTGSAYVRGNARGMGKEAGDGVPLRPQDITIPQILKKAGYINGMFGKWGLGAENTTGAPQAKGFDEFYGLLNQVDAHFYYGDSLWQLKNKKLERIATDTSAYRHDLIFNKALDFVKANKNKPFFLYLPVTIPHAELKAPDQALQAYLTKDGKSVFEEVPYQGTHYGSTDKPNATYAAMVSHLDSQVGQLLNLLKELNIDKNTIVFFTSDNGPHAEGGYNPEALNSNGPLRGKKRDLYEGGIRVPMLVWGPGMLQKGMVSEQIWAFWGVLPTIAGLTGTKIPAGIDGVSLANVIRGKAKEIDHPYLYWEFAEGKVKAQAIRLGNWKGIRLKEGENPVRFELYDLKNDLGETKDVAAENPQVAERLNKLLKGAHEPVENEEFAALDGWFN